MMSTEQKIIAWAEWSRSQNPVKALDYKSPALALIRHHMGGGVPLPSMSDDEALLIDAAIVRLRRRKPDLHQAMVAYYLHGKSQRAIAKILGGVGVAKVNSIIQQAVSWIDGQLDGIDIDAA